MGKGSGKFLVVPKLALRKTATANDYELFTSFGMICKIPTTLALIVNAKRINNTF